MTVWFLSMVSCSFCEGSNFGNKSSFVIPKRPGSVDHSGSHSTIAPHEWMSWEKRWWWWKRVLSEDTVNGRRQRGDRLKCGASEQQQRDKEVQTTEEWTSIYAVRSRESACLRELDFEIYSKKGGIWITMSHKQSVLILMLLSYPIRIIINTSCLEVSLENLTGNVFLKKSFIQQRH